MNNLELVNCSFNQLPTIDLSGLELLTTLNCSHNQLSVLHLEDLSNLHLLNCESNQINSTLNLNGLSNLNGLYCRNNQISNIDFSEPINLEIIDCGFNQFVAIDASPLTQLSVLYCQNNSQLTNLNLKNGSSEQFLDFSECENMTIICVDEGDLIAIQNLISEYGYANCQVSSTCDLANVSNDTNSYFSLSPNPVKHLIQLQTNDTVAIKSINVYDILGQIVQFIPNAEGISTIDVATLKTGTYFIKVTTDKGISTVKFLKE